MLGLAREEVLGRALTDMVSVSETAPGVQTWRLRGEDSEHRPLTAVATDREIPEPHGCVRTVTVITEEQARSLRSAHLFQEHDDAVTGLMSRGRFLAHLDEELRVARNRVRPTALLWIDIDNFTSVNDRLGHPLGDLVLRTIGRRLQEQARAFDVVARVGGDEFALLMVDDVSLESVESMVEHVRRVIREPLVVDGEVTVITVSIGVAICPVDGQGPEDLIRHADTAMRAAKEGGLDRASYFRREMHEAAQQRADIRHRLIMAVRDESFIMLYQPIVSIHTGDLVQAESLLRWREGESTHPASYFIHLAESAGILSDLSRIALGRVAGDLHTGALGDPTWLLPVSINLSPLQLRDRSVVEQLAALEIPGGLSRLVIEVTESAVLSTGSRALDSLRELQQLGMKVVIDDFGTGYSSIDLLERLRPTCIKVDKSLMLRSDSSPGARDLLAATVNLARALRATTTLEGIETEGHWNLARDLGADFAQGFWISRPLTLDQLTRFNPRTRSVTDLPDGVSSSD